MKNRTIYIFSFLIISSLSCTNQSANPCTLELVRAHQNKTIIPLVSDCDSTLTISKAYEYQKILVHDFSKTNQIIGYKAGLTSKSSQQKFGANQPVSGVLFSSGFHKNNVIIKKSDFINPIIETEWGFYLNTTVTEKTTLDKVKQLVYQIVPVIEIPDLRFSTPSKCKPVDVITANVLSADVIIGKPISLHKNINDVNIYLSQKDGTILTKGKGTDAMGNQWKALVWIINNTIDQGYSITPDHLLITGALGKVTPLKTGEYRAQFGTKNIIELKVVE